ncbi:MAG TPA: DUF58 domain-containing protein [Tepidisphaeraceae bacterium]|nr:DUF58 domain-containing protein [Tepidisphaeraceae bacterium]
MQALAYALEHPRLSSTRTVVRKKPSLDFSVTGLVYCSMMMFMGLAAINSQANLLFGVFGLMIGILLVSGVISRMVLRKLTVSRVLPEHAVVGQPMTISYHITNRKRFWPSLSVTVAELDGAEAFVKQPQAYMLHAAAQMTAIVPAEVIPKRRGLHQLDRHQIITSFPFGFIKRAMERGHKDSLLVYPAIGRVDPKVIQMCRSAETSGAMMRPRPGGADEFYGVKEYRAGENPRWIYWRRSARTGTLVSREMTHVSPPRILLMVDTWIDPAQRTRQVHADVERVIAIAASLASEALEQGLPVGLLVWSGGWVHIPPNRGKRHRRDLLTVLARLPLNTTHPQRALIDQSFRHLKSGTTAVLVSRQSVNLTLGESVRGGLVVLSPDGPMSQRWFKFERTVDFTRCMPAEQQVE